MTGQLPNARTIPFTHGAQLADVTIGLGTHWPGLSLTIVQRGQDLKLVGLFREDGRLRALTFSTERGEVTTADLRRPATIRTMYQCEAMAREVARRILAGEMSPDEPVDLTSESAESLRALLYGTPRRPGAGKSEAENEQQLREVTAVYRQAVDDGESPRKILAGRLQCSVSSVARLIRQAREPRDGQPPLLGPAVRGKAGEANQESRAA